jgi:hypothetical protein
MYNIFQKLSSKTDKKKSDKKKSDFFDYIMSKLEDIFSYSTICNTDKIDIEYYKNYIELIKLLLNFEHYLYELFSNNKFDRINFDTIKDIKDINVFIDDKGTNHYVNTPKFYKLFMQDFLIIFKNISNLQEFIMQIPLINKQYTTNIFNNNAYIFNQINVAIKDTKPIDINFNIYALFDTIKQNEIITKFNTIKNKMYDTYIKYWSYTDWFATDFKTLVNEQNEQQKDLKQKGTYRTYQQNEFVSYAITYMKVFEIIYYSNIFQNESADSKTKIDKFLDTLYDNKNNTDPQYVYLFIQIHKLINNYYTKFNFEKHIDAVKKNLEEIEQICDKNNNDPIIEWYFKYNSYKNNLIFLIKNFQIYFKTYINDEANAMQVNNILKNIKQSILEIINNNLSTCKSTPKPIIINSFTPCPPYTIDMGEICECIDGLTTKSKFNIDKDIIIRQKNLTIKALTITEYLEKAQIITSEDFTKIIQSIDFFDLSKQKVSYTSRNLTSENYFSKSTKLIYLDRFMEYKSGIYELNDLIKYIKKIIVECDKKRFTELSEVIEFVDSFEDKLPTIYNIHIIIKKILLQYIFTNKQTTFDPCTNQNFILSLPSFKNTFDKNSIKSLNRQILNSTSIEQLFNLILNDNINNTNNEKQSRVEYVTKLLNLLEQYNLNNFNNSLSFAHFLIVYSIKDNGINIQHQLCKLMADKAYYIDIKNKDLSSFIQYFRKRLLIQLRPLPPLPATTPAPLITTPAPLITTPITPPPLSSLSSSINYPVRNTYLQLYIKTRDGSKTIDELITGFKQLPQNAEIKGEFELIVNPKLPIISSTETRLPTQILYLIELSNWVKNNKYNDALPINLQTNINALPDKKLIDKLYSLYYKHILDNFICHYDAKKNPFLCIDVKNIHNVSKNILDIIINLQKLCETIADIYLVMKNGETLRVTNKNKSDNSVIKLLDSIVLESTENNQEEINKILKTFPYNWEGILQQLIPRK